MLETQYTGHSFDIVTLIVPTSRSKILCSIRIVLETTVNNGVVLT